MTPVLELRGAIPFAAFYGIPFGVAFPVAVLGNLVPVPFIILFVRRVFLFIRRRIPKLNRLVDRLEEKGRKKQSALEKGTFVGLFILVAVPLPGTGAWTGALVAAMTNLRMKYAFPAIALGVVTAGLIMGASYLVKGLLF
ncbi:MAG: small multi-drug export protein [Clostridia bacterium]|nr:small multi-drug export protein [Clostridia bacterium]